MTILVHTLATSPSSVNVIRCFANVCSGKRMLLSRNLAAAIFSIFIFEEIVTSLYSLVELAWKFYMFL